LREALDGFTDGYRDGASRISNLRYAVNIVLTATSLEELNTSVGRLVDAMTAHNVTIDISVDEKTLEQVRPSRT